MRHRRFLLMLLARSPVSSTSSSRRCCCSAAAAAAAAGSSSSSSSSSSFSSSSSAATATTPAIPFASRFAALRLSSSSALLRRGPKASPGRRCIALPLVRAFSSSREAGEAGAARFVTKRRMTNPTLSAEAPEPATAAAANAAVNPSSSSKREREQGGAAAGAAAAAGGDGSGSSNDMQQQQHQQQQQQNNDPFGENARVGGKRRRGGKGRPLTPEMLLRKEVHASAKRQDARAALAAFDSYLELLRGENARAREEEEKKKGGAAAAKAAAAAAAGEEHDEPPPPPPPYYHSPLWDPATSLVHLSSDVRNSLLYLCAGGDAWDAELAGPEALARRRVASGSVAVVVVADAPAAAASAAPADAAAAAAAAPDTSAAPAAAAALPPLPAEELARRGRELFDRTTVSLAAVERPLLVAVGSSSAAASAAAPSPPPPPPPPQQQQQLSADGEMAYTALARMQARALNPRGSLEAAREAVARGFPARLRCFSPALLAFSCLGDAVSAFAVEKEAREEHGLEMTEPELRFLASAAAAANVNGGEKGASSSSSSSVEKRVPFDAVESTVLTVLKREHGRLQRETIAAVEAYFTSLGPGEWRADRGAKVDRGTGRVLVPCFRSSSPSKTKPDFFTPDALGPVDLEPHEWEAFSSGVAALARARERSPPGAFDSFVEWCSSNGPFDAVVDGANVALFGQNWSHGDFSFAQLEAVLEGLKTLLGPGSKTLVVLHRSRLAAPAARDADGRRVLRSLASEAISPPSSQQPLVLQSLVASEAVAVSPSGTTPQPLPAQTLLYAAPHGSNDDWYWLHAAVAAGARGLIVSNDEMRDHVFQLLSPRFAARWKDRHQARYSFEGNYRVGGNNGNSSKVSAKLLLPPPFSECSQRLPRTGAWLFPRAAVVVTADEGGGNEDGDDQDEWLCCSPVA